MCEHLRQDVELVKEWIKFTSAKQKGEQVESHMSRPEFWKVFSYFEYSLQCTGSTPVTVKEPIEPLVGFIRDPVYLCKLKDVPNYGLVSREFLLLMDMKWRHASTDRIQIFDLGASTWHKARYPSSQEWFYKQYVKNGGYSLDRFVMWEAHTDPPETIFRDVDPEVLPYYQYFNLPVSADPSAKMHPWTFVKRLATGKNRHVVVKLDIDTPKIENRLMDLLLQDEALWSVVDEAFYEHHTNIPEMEQWWRRGGMSGELKDTYRIFSELRRRGVRMHGWP